MEKQTSNPAKFIPLIILTLSLMIALAGLLVLTANLEAKGSDPIAIVLLTVVTLILLLILFMMWKVGRNLRARGRY